MREHTPLCSNEISTFMIYEEETIKTLESVANYWLVTIEGRSFGFRRASTQSESTSQTFWSIPTTQNTGRSKCPTRLSRFDCFNSRKISSISRSESQPAEAGWLSSRRLDSRRNRKHLKGCVKI